MAARAGIGHHLIRKLVNHTQVLDVAHKYILIGVEGLWDPMQQITDRFISLMGCSPQDIRTQATRPKVVRRGFKSPSLDEVLNDYIKSKSLRPGAVKYYEKAIWTGLRDWAHLPVTEITVEMVLVKYRGLSKTRKPSYANVLFQVLRLLLNYAAEQYQTPAGRPIMETNPTRQLVLAEAFKKSPVKGTLIPEEKLADWYQAALTEIDPAARDVLLFAAFTGTTRSQALTLRWEEVDFERMIIGIRSKVCQNHRGYELPLPEFLDLLLRRRRTITADSAFVFPGRKGGHRVSTQRATTRVGEKIGHNFEMNDLRRGFVAAASNCGIGQQLIKRLTNHALSSDMTDAFFQPNDQDLREAMEKISAHLIGLMEIDLDDWRSDKISAAIG